MARHFVPQQFDPADWQQVQPLFDALQARAIGSVGELERFLTDFAELAAVLDEYGSRRYIDHTCHTDDPQVKQRYFHWIEEIEPRTKPLHFALQKKFLESPHLPGLKDPKYATLIRGWRAEVEIFREENVPLETQATKLSTQYDELCGAMTIAFRGEELTLPQAARFLEETDRAVRQEVWEKVAQRRYQDRDRIDEVFDQLIPLRNRIARNAGLADFRAYAWKDYQRFDYTPEQCLAFADAIAQTCVPLLHEVNRKRRLDLQLETLRPWDMDVDPLGRPPLRPFARDDTSGLVSKTRAIFERLSSALASDFDQLSAHHNLDLESRKGKAPGGYQCSLEETGQPFIFMNSAGTHGDVTTMLHEGGHAFHCRAARDELMFLRQAPIEFCEVASMAMELLGADHYDAFYSEADIVRARRDQFLRVVKVLPWIATIDSFQHWLYTHVGHTREQRTEQWLALVERFGAKIDYSGFEHILQTQWQRQLHLFSHPFYYVEYGIAQLGALQLWVRSRHDPRAAIANYRAALKLGGTRPLPELFSAAGIVFDFSSRTLAPLVDAVAEELASLPE